MEWRIDCSLRDQVAIITGGAQGIGLAIACSIAAQGCRAISLLDIQKNLAKTAASEVVKVAAICGHSCCCRAIYCDVSDASAVKSTVAAIAKKWGRLDIVIANAAIIPKATDILSPKFENALQAVVAVNLYGVLHTCRAAADTMLVTRSAATHDRNGKNINGKILIVGSIMADMVQAGKGHYIMCKAAARSIGKTLALEVAGSGINVNILQPGHVTTEGNPSSRNPKSVPIGRLATVHDIARVAAFLCSPAADYITGTVLDCDGGYKIGMVLPRL